MKKALKATLALLLCVLMLMSTSAIAFGVSVGAVKSLKAAAVSDSAVKLKWSTASKATGYLLYRYDTDSKTWTQKAKTTKTTWKDTVVDVGTKYSYRVRGYRTKGDKTVYGNYAPTLTVLTSPMTVSDLSAKASGGNTVTLSWSAGKGATVYKVYQKLSADKEYTAIGTTRTTSYKATYDAAVGKISYRVRSYTKSSGYSSESVLSDPVAVTLLPGAIKNVSAIAQTSASVTLGWDAAAGANQYIVYKKDVATGGAYQADGTTKNLTYTVTYPAAPGTAYFRVKPVAKTDNGTLKGDASASVKISFKPKKIASLWLGKATYNSITLNWPAADGVSHYRVYRVTKAGNRKLIGETEETSYKVTGLASNKTQTYTVRGVAAYSSSVLYTAFSPYLTASTIFGTMSALNFSLDSSNNLYLLWDQIKGADGYEIEKQTDSGWTTVGNISGTTFRASAAESGKTLANGKDYTYRVRAYIKDDGEIVYSDYSTPLTIRAVPAAPTDIRVATGSDHSVVLDWKAVPGAQGYEIYYYNTAKGDWAYYTTTEGNAYVQNGVTRVGYIQKNETESGDFQYKIRAISKNAGEDYGGKFSDVISYHYDYRPEPEEDFAPGVAASGILGYLYDERQQVFYTSSNPWQRNFGFNQFYDIFSQFVMIQYDTERICFTYQGDDWMIQPWKGQYGMILYGGEVGVYKKYTEREAQHYDCVKDEDRLMMAMSVYHYEAEKQEWVHVFDRPYATNWWITGFTPGFIRFVTPGTAQSFNNYPDIRLDIRITMKDFEMLNAVTQAMKDMDVPYTVVGLDVYFSF